MNTLLERAMELRPELTADRRYIHRHAEAGLELPITARYVESRLREMGYEPRKLGASGISAQIGEGGKTILLRADMDALPMKEESGLPFASETVAAHCCGHDLHTAMLLAAAKLLKERNGLKGTVKFMFQPGEETGNGAAMMMEQGILENPRPDAVAALHVNAKAPLGRLDYGKGRTFSSNDNVHIEITGVGGHGARPHETADPIKAANYIYMALQTVRTSDIIPMEPFILTITAINGGSAYNTIPGTASLKGTLRAYNEQVRTQGLRRVEEICKKAAELFHTTAKVSFFSGIPAMDCSPGMTDEFLGYAGEILGREKIAAHSEVKIGSEDFSFITDRYPESSVYLFLGAGPTQTEGFPYGQHNSKVIFNEAVLPYGAAILAHGAVCWLNNHSA